MRILAFSILILILLVCLFYNLYESFADPTPTPRAFTYGKPLNVKVEIIDIKTLNIMWDKPLALRTAEPITGYVIMIARRGDMENGVYLRFSNDTDCFECTYRIENINLEYNTLYELSVMAVSGKGGSGIPSDRIEFKTPEDPNLELNSNTQPTNQPVNMLTGEELISQAESEKRTYLDKELNNMVARAEGIYEIDKTQLEYPDNYIDDVKQSISTINDHVMKDLQEYRLNLHLATKK